MVVAGTLLAQRLWYRHRAHLFLERRGTEETPDILRVCVTDDVANLFDTSEMRNAIRRFRRRAQATSKEMDVDRTLNKTVQQGGWLVPVYGSRQQSPEYIALINRISYSDHLYQLVDDMLAVLRHGNVHVSSYYFGADPQLCSTASLHARSITLSELAAQATGQRLLIFGDAQAVLNPISGRPAEWTRLLAAWPVRALFTPVPPSEWGISEQQAAQVLGVWTALPEGLDLFIRSVLGEAGTLFAVDRVRINHLPLELRTRPIRWLQADSPQESEVQRVLADIRGYLGEWGYTWFGACAVYPQLSWNLTLFLGSVLHVEKSSHSPAFHRLLLDLARLPWFQYGVIPDWLRMRLISDLTDEQETLVRTALQGLLLTVLDSPNGSFQLEIAQTYQTSVRRLLRPLLRLLRRREGPHTPLNDHVFLAFMGGSARTQLALRLPEALRVVWRERGMPGGQWSALRATGDSPRLPPIRPGTMACRRELRLWRPRRRRTRAVPLQLKRLPMPWTRLQAC